MYEIDTDLFRQRLRDRLKQVDISQQMLADEAGINLSTIEKWLNGKSDGYDTDENGKKAYIPSLRTIYSVAQVLEVSIDYFVNPDMECLTVANQRVNDVIGLNNNAIDKLKVLHNPYSYTVKPKTPKAIIEYYNHLPDDEACKAKIAALNMLISNVNLWDNDILTYIYLYLTQTDTDNNHLHDDNTLMSYDANMLYRTALKDNIFIELQKLKDSNK